MSGEVLLRWPRRRRGKRNSVWTPPIQWIRSTIAAGLDVDIGDHLADHGADDALLEPGIGRRRRPDGLQIIGQVAKEGSARLRPSRGGAVVSGDLRLDLGDARERPVPARLQLRCDEAVGGIGGVVLPEGPIRRVARRFEIAQQRLADLIAPAGRFRLGLDRRGDRAWFDDLEQSGLDGVVDPQAAEGDAARLAIIEQAPVAGIAWDVVLHAAVADGQLAPTAPAADETSEQRVAVLGRAMMPARRHVLAHHPADRLRTLPIDVPVVRAGLQRQPFAARLAAALRPNARTVVLRRDAGSTIGVGAAVDWVRDHSVDGRVTRPAPDEVAVALPGGQDRAHAQWNHRSA